MRKIQWPEANSSEVITAEFRPGLSGLGGRKIRKECGSG